MNKVFTMKKVTEAVLGQGEMMELPGNSAFLFSHSVIIFEAYRGQGHGKAFMKSRINETRKDFPQGFFIFALVNTHNEPQIALMDKFGWEKLRVFDVSEADVALYVRNLWDNKGMNK